MGCERIPGHTASCSGHNTYPTRILYENRNSKAVVGCLESTLEAKAREESVSAACAGEGARLAIMRALALPPSESCSSIVSLEFLQSNSMVLRADASATASRYALPHFPLLTCQSVQTRRCCNPIACAGSTVASVSLSEQQDVPLDSTMTDTSRSRDLYGPCK